MGFALVSLGFGLIYLFTRHFLPMLIFSLVLDWEVLLLHFLAE